MKFIILSIVFITIASASRDYLALNCSPKSYGKCYIFLVPNGETFNNKFLPVLDGLTHASLKMGITGYEVDPKTILGHANEEIEEYVTAGQYKHFIKRLHDNSINPKNDVVVILMADLNPYFLPDKYEKISSTFKAAVKVNELKDRIDKRKPKIYFGTYQGNF